MYVTWPHEQEKVRPQVGSSYVRTQIEEWFLYFHLS